MLSPHAGRGELLHARRAEILQIDKLLRRRQRRLDGVALTHECDDLRQTNRKFERRFAAIEQALAVDGKKPQDATLAEMDALWDAAKARE